MHRMASVLLKRTTNSLLSRRAMSPSAFTSAPTPTSDVSTRTVGSNPLEDKLFAEEVKLRKKPRKKKQDVSQQLEEQQAQPQRPGKKKLRKLRYQQKQQTPKEFLITSAECLDYTGSVILQRPTALYDQDQGEADFGSSKIHVVTSSSAVDPTPVHPPPDKIRIQIQPLLILDVNGILCHRVRKSRDTYDPTALYRPDIGVVANTPIIARPLLQEFLSFLQQHFVLAIWTSAKKKTATQLINRLVPPTISSRFLFVWAQHDCHVQSVPQDQAATTHPRDILFEKDLSKVWKAYPLWNAMNTLLMDDSPEKCSAVKHNAVHPPPLNGRVLGGDNIGNILSDEENVARQMELMQQLARHWVEYPLMQEWDEEAGDSVFHATKTLADFLREHAKDYQGIVSVDK